MAVAAQLDKALAVQLSGPGRARLGRAAAKAGKRPEGRQQLIIAPNVPRTLSS